MSCCLRVLVLCFAIAVAAAATEVVVVLDTGQEVQGTLAPSDHDHVAIALPDMGEHASIHATLLYERAHVLKLTPISTALPEYQDRRRTTPDTAAAHEALAVWCQSQDLLAEAREEALRAEALAPTPAHAQLLLRLGMTYADGDWQVEDQYLARTGRVRFAGTIMRQEEATALQVLAADHTQLADTLASIQRTQGLLARYAEERVALARQERHLQEQLAAADAAIARHRQAIDQLRVVLASGAQATPAAVDDARQAAAAATAALPGLDRQRLQIVEQLLTLPADRESLAQRTSDAEAALAVAQERLASLRAELASFASAPVGR